MYCMKPVLKQTTVLDAATGKLNLVKITEDWAVELKRQYDTTEMEINAHTPTNGLVMFSSLHIKRQQMSTN